MSLINEVEADNRGYYTGVTILFDGESIDSCVNIRFVEQRGDSLVYHSGGGITAQSDCKAEYDELKDKIYVPIA